MKEVSILFIYVISISISSFHYFFVISLVEIFLIFLIGMTWYFLLKSIKIDGRIIVVLLHFLFALIIHPAIEFKDKIYISTSEQFEILRALNHSKIWHIRSDISYDLSRYLMENSMRHLRLSSPLVYWMFPPSIALIIWGCLILKFFPKEK